MDDVIKNIRKKLSVDNLVEMMKDAKVIDENHIKEDAVRKTLEVMDPEKLIDINDLTEKLNEITEEAAKISSSTDHREEVTEKPVISSAFTVLGQSNKPGKVNKQEDETYLIPDNISGFFD